MEVVDENADNFFSRGLRRQEEKRTREREMAEQEREKRLRAYMDENAQLIELQRDLEKQNRDITAQKEELEKRLKDAEVSVKRSKEEVEMMTKNLFSQLSLMRAKDAKLAALEGVEKEISMAHAHRLAFIRDQVARAYDAVHMELIRVLGPNNATPEIVSALESLRLIPWKNIV